MVHDKIKVFGDSRVQSKSIVVNGKQYGYLLSQPQLSQYRATIFLLHGFPDLSMGWRYQIPVLVNLGLRVIALDCLGYGRTEAPDSIALYSHKQCADDVRELARQLGCTKIIVGGHDWGASLAYRVALWHPDLVSHIFTVCVPFAAVTATYISLQDMVSSIAPHFAYQLQFCSGDVEKAVRSKDEIRSFLCALYGGRTETGEIGFDVRYGVFLEKILSLKPSKLLNNEKELEYYVDEFLKSGIHGPLNWYRTRKINHDEELAIQSRRIAVPVLFIQALKDQALPPHLGRNMAKKIPQLTVRQVDTTHWALWEKPEEVNKIITRWLKEVVFKEDGSKL